jgi:hypothetical protein
LINLGFKTEGKLAAVLIIPSSWDSQQGVIYMPSGTPFFIDKISGHFSRHYIFVASYAMHFSWSVFIFAFSFLFFVCYNKWLDPNMFLLEKTHSIFIA